METICMFVVFISFITAIISFISLFRPLSLFYLSNRKRAVIALISSLFILNIGVVLSPSYNPSLTHEEFEQEFQKESIRLNDSIQELTNSLKKLFLNFE